MKLNADFQADCLVEEKKFERMDKELLKKLQELKKSHLNFTAEREMEFVMQNRDNEGGNFSTTTNSAVHSEDNRSSKFDGKPTLTDLAEAPRETRITSREVCIHLLGTNDIKNEEVHWGPRHPLVVPLSKKNYWSFKTVRPRRQTKAN